MAAAVQDVADKTSSSCRYGGGVGVGGVSVGGVSAADTMVNSYAALHHHHNKNGAGGTGAVAGRAHALVDLLAGAHHGRAGGITQFDRAHTLQALGHGLG